MKDEVNEKRRKEYDGEKEHRRKAKQYDENQEKERERKRREHEVKKYEVNEKRREEYDSEEEHRRKAKQYDENQEKERERKRREYEVNKDEVKARRLLRIRSRTPEERLELCEGEPDYGPVFGCEVCHQLFFLEDVVASTEVTQLRDEESRREFVDVEFVDSHPSLFEQLDRRHCCRKCRKSIEGGGLPAAAALNDLKCTWASHSRDQLSLAEEELECLSLGTMFFTVEGIRRDVQGRRPGLTKKVMVPTGELKPSEWLVDYNARDGR